MRYSRNQKQQLTAFLEHGDVPISNNLAGNVTRSFVVGRKNWLFCDSAKGAQSSAIVYSLVETAKANRIEPYDLREPIFISIDDTVITKTKPSFKAKHSTEGMGWYYSHLEGKVVYGYQVHAAIVRNRPKLTW